MSSLYDIAQGIGRLEGKVDGLIAAGVEDRAATQRVEERISAVEQRQARLVGIGVVLGTFGASLVAFALKFFGAS